MITFSEECQNGNESTTAKWRGSMTVSWWDMRFDASYLIWKWHYWIATSRRHAWVLLLYRYIYSFSERRPLAPTCFREVFYICMSKSIFHWSHRENLTVASIDKRSRKNFCTLIIFPLYQIKAFTILYWHFLGMQPTVPKKSFAIFYSWLKNPDKWEFRNN